MYPDLSYFFHDLLGTSLDNWTSIFKTFGFMLVMALVACGVFLKKELLRLEKEGKVKPVSVTVTENAPTPISEIIGNSIFLTIIVAKLMVILPDISTFSANPAGLIFSKHGNWVIGILVGFATGFYQFWKTGQKNEPSITKTILHYPSSRTNDIIILAGLSGVLGSKLFSIIEDLPSFFEDPAGTFLSGSGLNVYGGLIVAFATVYYFVNKIGIKPIYMMDIAGMGILLGYAIGRIGCQLSGDGDWGIVAAGIPEWWFLPDWLWSYQYPNNVNNDGILIASCQPEIYQQSLMSGMSSEQSCATACGMRYCHQLSAGVYPTPIYETAFGLFAFAMLYINKHRFKIPGMIFFTYMIINGAERFLIELIRVNEKHSFLGLSWSQAQYISVGFVLGGIAGIFYLIRTTSKMTE
jgi:prolipoprotein diacylglyceryltransferase